MIEEIKTESGVTVDGYFGYQSISDRIVRSAEIMGTMNRVMPAASKEMARIYREGK